MDRDDEIGLVMAYAAASPVQQSAPVLNDSFVFSYPCEPGDGGVEVRYEYRGPNDWRIWAEEYPEPRGREATLLDVLWHICRSTVQVAAPMDELYFDYYGMPTRRIF